ncbi:MAG: deoxyribodipyrimidine photolyase [Fibrobacteres bacterium]|nr:deoxyribodipyrimidine photolyase [Fibrobacterota bacterium]
MTAPTLVWFRQDLRVSDHAALREACAAGPVIPVFIFDPEGEAGWAPGGAGRWWLHHSLAALDPELRARGSRLILRRGDSREVLEALIRETGAAAVHWSRRYEPGVETRDRRIFSILRERGIRTGVFSAALLFEPESIRTKAGGPYQVFTPYWRACMEAPRPAPPLPAPRNVPAPATWPSSLPLAALGLLPETDWAEGMRNTWRPGSKGARELFSDRLDGALGDYAEGRDFPEAEGTSRLSPHLHFGEIGIREVWAALTAGLELVGQGPAGQRPGRDQKEAASLRAWQRQLIWREFAHHLLVHFPHTPADPLRPGFAAFPWARDPEGLKAWRMGRTGYPYVDAGMRQLWATGWMHNRVRMAAASFLVKHLLLPWQAGAAWFWDTLVDADLAQNTMGWQWVSGSGADAAPYFRIFHPVTQGERFDAQGAYIRRWVPELSRLEAPWIHRPWEAPLEALARAGVDLGANYPRPLVDHAQARTRALAAYHSLRT